MNVAIFSNLNSFHIADCASTLILNKKQSLFSRRKLLHTRVLYHDLSAIARFFSYNTAYSAIFPGLHNPKSTCLPAFVVLAERFEFLIINHQTFERLNTKFKRRVIQQKCWIDVELDAGCKAHHSSQDTIFFFHRKEGEMRFEIDLLFALLGLLDYLDFILIKEAFQLFL